MIKRKSVDLPQPLGPISTVVFPRPNERSEGWSAVVVAEHFADSAKLNECTHNLFLTERRRSAKIYSVALPSEGHASACPGRAEARYR